MTDSSTNFREYDEESLLFRGEIIRVYSCSFVVPALPGWDKENFNLLSKIKPAVQMKNFTPWLPGEKVLDTHRTSP